MATAGVVVATVVVALLAPRLAALMSYGPKDPEDKRPDRAIVSLIGAALMFWPWCLAVLVSVIADIDHQDGGFYATAAQIIPVLFISLLFSTGVLGLASRRPEDADDESKMNRWHRAFEWTGWLASIFSWQTLFGEAAALYGATLNIQSTFLVVGLGAVILVQLVALGQTALMVFWARAGAVVEHGVKVHAVESTLGMDEAPDPEFPGVSVVFARGRRNRSVSESGKEETQGNTSSDASAEEEDAGRT